MTDEPAYRILILGGYGNFGLRIARALATHAQCHLILAGRDEQRAREAIRALNNDGATARLEGIRLDSEDPQFARRLVEMQVKTVIHTAGPFQGQSYAVANACIEA